MIRIKSAAILLAVTISLLPGFSCFQRVTETEMREIFTVDIGFDQDDIGAHTSSSLANTETFQVAYKNGFFYVSDAANDKLLKISEKGEPVLFIYNPVTNPFMSPTEDGVAGEEASETYARLYRPYPVHDPGLITADNRKHLYCINRHPDYKMTNDDGTIVDQMILKFSPRGEVQYLLGRKGIDSIPFGYISHITCDELNRLMVFEIAQAGFNLYLFSEEGELVTMRTITNSVIPLTRFESENLVDIIDIIPGYRRDELYITCQFIREMVSNMNIVNYETLYEKVMLYSIDTGKVTKLQLKIQPVERDLSGYPRDAVKALYGDARKVPLPIQTLVGADHAGRMYFTQRELPISRIDEHTGYIYTYDQAGKLLSRRMFRFPMESSYISDLHFSSNGTIFAYYIEKGRIHFVTFE
jgi:hypothetical protein